MYRNIITTIVIATGIAVASIGSTMAGSGVSIELIAPGVLGVIVAGVMGAIAFAKSRI
jgi:hypothetical protein